MNDLESKIITDYCAGISESMIARNLYVSEYFVKDTIEKYRDYKIGSNKIDGGPYLEMFALYGLIIAYFFISSNIQWNVFQDIGILFGCVLGMATIGYLLHKITK